MCWFLKIKKNIILIYFDTVCLKQFRFFLKKISAHLLFFFYKNKTDLKKTTSNFKHDSSDFLNLCYHVTSYANPVIIIACCSRRILSSYSSSASLSWKSMANFSLDKLSSERQYMTMRGCLPWICPDIAERFGLRCAW